MKIRRSVKILLLCLAVISAAAAVMMLSLRAWNASCCSEWAASEGDGRMVKAGDHSLYCELRGSSGPVVIFEGDAGFSSAEWRPVAAALAERCRTLVYDRAGYGRSEAGPFPRTGEQITAELYELLKNLGLENGPFILAGQGLGAWYMEMFAASHPEHVLALILAEPMTSAYPLFKETLDPVVYSNLLDRGASLKMTGILGRAGIIRLLEASPYTVLPDEIKKDVVENYSRPEALDAMYDEYRRGPVRRSAVNNSLKLPSVPLTVLTHSRDRYRKEMMNYYLAWNDIDEIEKIWSSVIHAVSCQASSFKSVQAETSLGNICLEEPGLFVQAVKEYLSSGRKK